MKKFEYKVLEYKTYTIYTDNEVVDEMGERFTKLSNDGWELFHIVTACYGEYNYSVILYHFRRQVKR